MASKDHSIQSPNRRLTFYVRAAQAALFWEGLWPRLWPAVIITSLWAWAILYDLFPQLNAFWHVTTLCIFAFGSLGTIIWAVYQAPQPTEQQALKRLGAEAKLPHNAFQSLWDAPATPLTSSAAQALWAAHQTQAHQALRHLRFPLPRASLDQQDPYSLRAVLILGLVLGAVFSASDFSNRVNRAFAPSFVAQNALAWQVNLWVTPPDYTKLPAQHWQFDADSPPPLTPLSVQQHSEAVIRVTSASPFKAPLILHDSAESTQPFLSNNETSATLTISLAHSDQLTLHQGKRSAFLNIPLALQADFPAEITLRPPKVESNAATVHIPFEVSDDFGAKQAGLTLRPLPPDRHPPIVIEQPLNDQLRQNGQFRLELSAHPWAGRRVVATPKVIDSADQTAYGQAIEIHLPERRFHHPMAQTVIEWRRNLIDRPEQSLIPVQSDIYQATQTPSRYKDDVHLHLALNSAWRRLTSPVSYAQLDEVIALLWDSAVHLEEGDNAFSRHRLGDLARQLESLMQQQAAKDSLETAFDTMEQALTAYLNQLALDTPILNEFADFAASQGAETVDRNALLDMLEKARSLMRLGNWEAAQQLMAQFQNIMSHLAAQPPADPALTQAAQGLLQDLKTLEADQGSLLQQSFQRVRQPSGTVVERLRAAAHEALRQADLRTQARDLQDALKNFGVRPPDGLDDAIRAMGNAQGYLENGLDEQALQAQTNSVQALRQATQDGAAKLARALGLTPPPSALPTGTDPRGRGRGGSLADQRSLDMVPDDAALNSTREILQELYRRAGQTNRSSQELDYIHRLIKPFQ